MPTKGFKLVALLLDCVTCNANAETAMAVAASSAEAAAVKTVLKRLVAGLALLRRLTMRVLQRVGIEQAESTTRRGPGRFRGAGLGYVKQ